MIPTGAVIPGPTIQWGATVGELLGPVSMFAVLAILVALAVVIAGIVADFRARAAFKRSCSASEPASQQAYPGPRRAA